MSTDSKCGCSPKKENGDVPPVEPQVSCCSAPAATDGCSSDREAGVRPGFRLEPFVDSWLSTPLGPVPQVKTRLSAIDIRGRWAMRWGIGRNHYQVTPGLYAVGTPDENSEVLVSANYKFSFDVLRRAAAKLDVWLLVLDTKGVNVWCAAGKGTFGTDEIVRRVKAEKLESLVNHRRLIVPQLGAPGVAAHRVQQGCGFKVVYGPIRATDLPAFLAAGRKATPEMRRVSFTLVERAVLTPVEIVVLRRQILFVAVALLLLGGIGPSVFSPVAAGTRGGGALLAGFGGLFAGAVATPILLPWLPGRAFALKGLWPGLALALLLGATLFSGSGVLNQTALLLQVSAISSYTAMNFTGSTTFTSPSGVEKEMRAAIPAQLAAAALALALWLWAAF